MLALTVRLARNVWLHVYALQLILPARSMLDAGTGINMTVRHVETIREIKIIRRRCIRRRVVPQIHGIMIPLKDVLSFKMDFKMEPRNLVLSLNDRLIGRFCRDYNYLLENIYKVDKEGKVEKFNVVHYVTIQ